MAKKVRYQMKTTFAKKQADQKNLKQFDVKNVSTQRNKAGENFILFSIQSEDNQVKFEAHAAKNKIEYKILD